MKYFFGLILVVVLLSFSVYIFDTLSSNFSLKDKNLFTTYLSNDPANLDPAKGVDVAEASVQAKIFDGLLRYNEKMELVPALASSWSISEDAKTYNFVLRKDVRFHCGQPFTAKDVLFSFKRILDPSVSSPRTWVLERVLGADKFMAKTEKTLQGIEVVDEFNISITLTEPFAPFLSLLTMPACYILPSETMTKMPSGEFFELPSGTGPFKIVERIRDSYIALEANTDYFAEKPKVSQIYIRVIAEPMTAEMEFESGGLDFLQLHPSNFDRFYQKEKYRDRIQNVAALNVFYVGLNNQLPPFNDIRVRQALNMLIDRDLIIKEVYSGRAARARGSIPPGISGYNEQFEGYSYDPQTAISLLEEAGFNEKNPLTFDLFQRSSQAAFEITRLIQGELLKHGINVNLRPMEWSAMLDAVTKGEAQSFYISWFGDYPDGENFLYPLFHSSNHGTGGNRAMFKDETVDAMLEEAVKLTDEKKRAAFYDEINQKIVQNAPWIYLWHTSETYLTSPSVETLDFYPLFFVDKGLTVKMNAED